MEHSCLHSKWILLIFFHGILLLFMSSSLKSARIPSFADESDRLALLDFRNQIREDPLQIMSLWNDSIHFCNWFGVTCIPSSKRVKVLNLEAQRLAGTITPSMGNLTHLTGIILGNNSIYGEIPQEVGRLRRLQHLNLSSNSFGGNLPTNLSHCRQLLVLSISYNKLVGHIPEQLSSLSKLVHLNLAHNNLTGTIPAWIGNFSSLYNLSLGRNNLQGSIPSELGRLSRLGFLQLSANNLSGSFGSVYKGVLSSNGAIVAVKVLNLQQRGASKSFIDECNALKSLRHRNLLKIITACSSINHQGNEFKSLVFEFMSNGSLDQWLHSIKDEQHRCKRLSFIQRLNIAMDVAYALEYLHLHCQTPIVHCDVKPSNVLLNEDMVAHVGDFGLAKFIFEASHNPSKNQTMSDCLSVMLKGSVGYIPPEYGIGGQVSVLGDIYSFGVLLLEMFTGKRPTDDMFKDGLSIHKFTAMALPEHVMDIVDSSMPFEEDADDETNNDDIEESPIIEEVDHHFNAKSRVKDCLVSVLQIGLLCSATSPHERLPTNDVVNKLRAIKGSCILRLSSVHHQRRTSITTNYTTHH